MSSPNALHSAKTPRWGTPQHIIEYARELLDNVIHLDPATSPEFNQFVKAEVIYTEQDNGLLLPWAGNVFVNPPGGLVREFWRKLQQAIQAGDVSKAFWVGFSVEQLCQLADEEFTPVDFSCCILRKRLNFNKQEGLAIQAGNSPSHGNYVVGLGVDRTHFDRLFTPLGKVLHGPLTP